MPIRPFQGIRPELASGVYVDDMAVVIGDVKMGEDCSVWPMAVVRGDVNSIRIGARTNIQDGTVIHVTHRYRDLPEGHATIIGDDVTIGHNVTLHGCTVHDQCLIGIGSTVMDGAILNPQILLGAGSLVPEGRELASGYLWLGRPAKRIRPLTAEELDWFKYSAIHYVKLKDTYMTGSGS